MNEEEELIFELKNSGKSIRIEPIDLIYASSEEWDRNWIKTKISVSAGAFSGSYIADLTTFDFENLKQDLKSLYDNKIEKFEFEDLENFLSINIDGNSLGSFTAKIICIEKPDIETQELTFTINFDQTYIRPLVIKLNEITKRFPIVGNYNKNNYEV